MAIGLGVVLIVVGAIIMWALNLDLSFVEDSTLGLILMIAGILTIVLSLIVNAQQTRRRTTHVEERRFENQ
ncbi:MAG: DUF6458 family protein [Nocardioidaceae bacterium]